MERPRFTLFVAAAALAATPALAHATQATPAKPAAATGSPAEELAKQAEAKRAAGDLDGAAELLQKAVTAAGASGDTSLQLGRVLEAKHDLDGAIDAYQAASGKLDGASKGEALGRLSVIQEARGVAAAGATAEAAAAADAEGVWPAIALSRARARAGKADEALALAEKASASGGAAGAAALGNAQEAKGDLVAAEKTYRSAAAMPDGKVAGNVGLARVLRKTGRAAEAEPLLRDVLTAAPGAVDAYKESVRVKLALGRPMDALADASTAAAISENDLEAQKLVKEVTVAQAFDYVTKNQHDLAIQELTKIRDQDPGFAEARVGLAKAYVAKRQPDQAIAELKKAVEIDANLAEAQYQLGFVNHVMKNNVAAALPAYEKAVALEPANPTYRTNLGAALVAGQQADRAVKELTKVTEAPGYNRPDAWIYLGQAHLSAKRYKDAIPPLEKATTMAPNADLPYAYLGWCYFGLKDPANFKKAAGKAKALGHKEPMLLDYLSRVEAGEPIK